ncbi:MAG TPA: hypothetical protein VLF67_01390 [Candidatus Saccharimonas sp.]|nr:hypothetical protein [Candidatus Saccharimonas sp.]
MGKALITLAKALVAIVVLLACYFGFIVFVLTPLEPVLASVPTPRLFWEVVSLAALLPGVWVLRKIGVIDRSLKWDQVLTAPQTWTGVAAVLAFVLIFLIMFLGGQSTQNIPPATTPYVR